MTGSELRQLRRDLHVTQQELADCAGRPWRAILTIERDEVLVDPAEMDALADHVRRLARERVDRLAPVTEG